MNFFEQQDRARQNTQWLVGLFILAVLCIILTIYGAAVLAFGMVPHKAYRTANPYGTVTSSNQRTGMQPGLPQVPASRQVKQAFSFWNPQLFMLVSVPTLLLIGGGSLYKIQALQSGGAVVAQEMGGRIVTLDTPNPAESQLLNVVEEMAIASGISIPAVYVMDAESGINAFAAGFTPNNAVIGVTRGTLEQLSRDELQGVIGHEFSHILNGDMRLNLHLIGVLNGILLIYIAGRVLTYVPNRNDRSNLALFGLALILVGSVGLFFGRLIKAAASRQREFLADASAVQFTRSTTGIAGALRKIAKHHYLSLVQSPYAESNSHLFFGSALRFDFLGELFATHPPLEKRIQRLESRGGKYSAPMPSAISKSLPIASEGLVSGLAGAPASTPARSSATAQLQVNPDQVVAQVGTVSPEHFAYAHALVSQLPEPLQLGIRERQSAIAIVYALLLDTQDSETRVKQVEWLRQVEPANMVEHVLHLVVSIDDLDPGTRLPLLDLTVPALRQSSVEQCRQLFKCIQGLAQANGRWSLSEFTLHTVLWHRLQPCLNPKLDKTVQYNSLGQIWSDCLLLLSALAQVGQTGNEAINYAFRSGVFRLPGAGQQEIPEAPPACNLSDLKKCLDRLSLASPKLKQAIVDASAHTALLDNTVTVQEAELLRAIAIALDCPLPPFLNRSSQGTKR